MCLTLFILVSKEPNKRNHFFKEKSASNVSRSLAFVCVKLCAMTIRVNV